MSFSLSTVQPELLSVTITIYYSHIYISVIQTFTMQELVDGCRMVKNNLTKYHVIELETN